MAELIKDASLVFIDTLAVNGSTVPLSRKYSKVPATVTSMPVMTIRKSWNTLRDVPTHPIITMDSDGLVCGCDFRTVRLKAPIVDLLYNNGRVHIKDGLSLTIVSDVGLHMMVENTVYVFTVTKSTGPYTVILSNPAGRLIKKRPTTSRLPRERF